ncbi:MAG: mitochondrial fission ELM1 family protein [Gammaproteobacteria bacterium]|nr:mitochondrial fission ELM1 family protein [Gammaproteobacteria bacterium]
MSAEKINPALPERPPVTWLLMGSKAGDNSQVLALGEALGWPFEIKRFAYRKYELMTNLLLGATLAGVDKQRSSRLLPPWPELVISAGRRNEPICRWIQAQARRDGQRVRLVHLGRPWALYERFDLVVTTPQYRLPQRPGIVHNDTPLHRITKERLASEQAIWAPRLAPLPKPYVAVAIGGNSGPYTLDRKAAGRLAREASKLANEQGGSLLVTTSARTPPGAIAELEASLTAPAYVYRWRRDATENPYFAFLGLADAIVVTGDSMSMLTEACATQKPVYIFDLGEGPYAMRQMPGEDRPRGVSRERFRWKQLDRDYLRAFVYRNAMRTGPRRLTRDIGIIHKRLVETGRAVWLGDRFPAGHRVPPLQDLERAVRHVRALFKEAGDDEGVEQQGTGRRFVLLGR